MRGRIGGFTLLEVAVVLALIGLLASWAAWNLSERLSHDRLNQAARQLASDLRAARHWAVASHQRTHLRFISEESYLLEREDPRLGWTPMDSAIPLAERYPGVRLADGGEPYFHPKGLVVPTATFILQSGEEERTITVSMTGRVRIR